MILSATHHLDHALPAQVAQSTPKEERRSPFYIPTPQADGKQREKREGERLITPPPAPAVTKTGTVHERQGSVGFKRAAQETMPRCSAACMEIRGRARSALNPGQPPMKKTKPAQNPTYAEGVQTGRPGADIITAKAVGEIEQINTGLKGGAKVEAMRRIIERHIREWDSDGSLRRHAHETVEVNKGEDVEMIVRRSLRKIELITQARAKREFQVERRRGSKQKGSFVPLEQSSIAQELASRATEKAEEVATAVSTNDGFYNPGADCKTSNPQQTLLERYPEATDRNLSRQIFEQQGEAQEAQLRASYPEFYEEPIIAVDDEYRDSETARGTLRYEPTPKKRKKLNLS